MAVCFSAMIYVDSGGKRMKKTWLILGMAACLVGCTGKNVTPSPSAAPAETPTVEPTATPAPVPSQAPKKTLDDLPLSKEYVDQMEGYEDIEIVLLGCVGVAAQCAGLVGGDKLVDEKKRRTVRKQRQIGRAHV